MYEFLAWAYSDMVITGPDPFSSDASANSSAPGNSTITIASNATPTVLSVTDDDEFWSDGDSSQRYQGPGDFNGGNGYAVGDQIETEYSYIIRPVGSNDPADNITIYMIEIDADGQGIASDAPLVPGVTYSVIAIDSTDPVVAYSSLFVCFGSGTLIATPNGDRAVETLAPGDLVITRDHGPQQVRWTAARTLRYPPSPERQKPIQIKRHSFGPNLPCADLVLSPQHAVMLSTAQHADRSGGEVLVKAKHLTAVPGVRQMKGCRDVTYVTLLFDRHEIITANGLAVESFYPARYGLGLLTSGQRNEILALFPQLRDNAVSGFGPHARPMLDRRESRLWTRRMLASRGTGSEQPSIQPVR